jgi:hypothetical protein
VGPVLRLKAHHYAIPGKDRVSDIGQAVDACVKELVAPLGAVPSPQFAPHDYLLDGVYHEIKSSAGTWLSIPNSELEFATEEIDEGRDVIYDVVLQLDMQSARFLGSVPMSQFYHLVEPSKFLTWRLLPTGWVQERSHRVLLSKVKPLLT